MKEVLLIHGDMHNLQLRSMVVMREVTRRSATMFASEIAGTCGEMNLAI